mmetsp:Transcript_89711/g.262277  ORF Transcript_89711/g.262277 Transcript_89711/m.262277 type:complete len:251 (+) Transcript_89711:243-995(+)
MQCELLLLLCRQFLQRPRPARSRWPRRLLGRGVQGERLLLGLQRSLLARSCWHCRRIRRLRLGRLRLQLLLGLRALRGMQGELLLLVLGRKVRVALLFKLTLPLLLQVLRLIAQGHLHRVHCSLHGHCLVLRVLAHGHLYGVPRGGRLAVHLAFRLLAQRNLHRVHRAGHLLHLRLHVLRGHGHSLGGGLYVVERNSLRQCLVATGLQGDLPGLGRLGLPSRGPFFFPLVLLLGSRLCRCLSCCRRSRQR